ncbi:MAG: arsenate reductase ArsC [Planctomycetota bacterium]
MAKKKVLFLCTGNSCRSQMAEGLLRHINPAQYEAFSAGTRPSIVSSRATKVMHEIGIDISGQCSKSVDEFSEELFDIVITLCDNAKKSCPAFPDKVRQIHWSMPDPISVIGDEQKVLEAFGDVRDQIRKRIEEEFVER